MSAFIKLVFFITLNYLDWFYTCFDTICQTYKIKNANHLPLFNFVTKSYPFSACLQISYKWKAIKQDQVHIYLNLKKNKSMQEAHSYDTRALWNIYNSFFILPFQLNIPNLTLFPFYLTPLIFDELYLYIIFVLRSSPHIWLLYTPYFCNGNFYSNEK